MVIYVFIIFYIYILSLFSKSLFFIWFSTLPPRPVWIYTTELGFLLISGDVFPLPKLFDKVQKGCQEVNKKHINAITWTYNKVREKSNKLIITYHSKDV